MICQYCHKKAVFTENKAVYGKNYGRSYMIWLCIDCDSYVGTHENNSERPKGTLANAELREWRKRAHQAIDQHWQSGEMTRKQMYKRLKKMFGVEIHIGQLGVDSCKKLVDLERSGEIG